MRSTLAFLMLFIFILVLTGSNVVFAGTIWEGRVSSGNDDAEEDVNGGGIDLSSSDLEMLDDGGLQVIGLRFVDIPIPKGAIVDEAYVEFTCDETKSGTLPVSLLIEGELDSNPVAFSSATNDITARPRTTAKTVWVPADWTEVGQTDRSSNIASIIQEIIDLDGWAGGNAIAIIIQDDPDHPSEGVRCAEASSDPSNAPLLHVEYRGKYAMQPTPPDGGLYEDTSAVLSWLAGLNAVSHDVYFGENFAEVSDGTGDTFQGNQVETFFTVGVPGTPIPDGLVPGTTYYWRIDELEADGTTNPGPVWSFTVPSKKAYGHNLPDGAQFIDPQTDLSWTAGSGAKIHTVFFGDTFEDVNSATMGITQAGTTYDPGPLERAKTYYWRVDEFDGIETHKGDVLSFTTLATKGIGLRGDYYTGMNFEEFVLTRIDPTVDFVWGDTAPDEAVGTDSFSVRWTGDVSAQFTETYTFYTITDDGLRLWVDDQLVIENWTLHGDTEDKGTIDLIAGRTYNIVMEYFENNSGATARLLWESPHIVKQTVPTYLLWPPIKARSPKPSNGATGTTMTPVLTWSPGEYAVSHDVYFGTDAEAVKNATTTSPEYKGTKALGDESYDPGKLAWHTAYYWRIDEVNDLHSDSPWIGSVWTFTTGDFLVVDDFEAYNDLNPDQPGSNRIFESWIDGFGTTTNGALIGYETAPYLEQTIVHSGRQSMPYAYDNNQKTSEAILTLIYPRDWTEENVAELSLWFRGDSANTAERMYVALDDSAVVYHEDPVAPQTTTWTEWIIDLQAFSDQGVNLTNVDTLTLGFGTKNNPVADGSGQILFDDIRLYRTRNTQ